MNPENKGFINHEEETVNKVEDKEKKEYINLSFASAADLVRQIEEKGYFDGNEYQESCQFIVIHNKKNETYDFWDLGTENYQRHTENLENEDDSFYNEFYKYLKNADEKNMKVFFCGSKQDIRLKELREDDFKKFFEFDEKNGHLTPDGIYYKFLYSSKGDFEGISYSEEKQLSVGEVKEIRELSDKRGVNYIIEKPVKLS